MSVQDIFDFLEAWFSNIPAPAGSLTVPYAVGDGITSPDSVVGYCGYLLNPECGLYTVRKRASFAESTLDEFPW